MWKIFRLLFLYVFVVTVSSSLSFGQITYTSVQSGDWDDQVTWGNTGPPADTDNVTIAAGHAVLLAGKTTINNLTIDGGGILDDNNKDLTINGNFILNGTKTGRKETIFNGGPGTFIAGTGVHSSTKSLIINQSTSIQAGAVLTFTTDIEMESNVIVTNNGSVSVTNDLKGADDTSRWINSTNSTLTVGGKLLNKGTLDASAQENTVIYNQEGNQDIKLPTGSPATYFNLIVEGIGDKTLTGDITIDGSLTINSSTLDTSQGDNFGINIKGDFTNFGTFNENLSTITFEGPNQQVITNSSGETFYNVTVNKPSGSITLEDDVTISNVLDLSAGIIEADPGTLILGTGPANPGTLNITSGQIIGPFERWISNSQAGLDIEFPVGSQIAEKTAIINFTGINTGGTVVFEFIAENPGNNGLSLVDGAETIYNTFVDGYWEMQVSDGFDIGANTYSLSLNGTGFLGFPIVPETRLLTHASQSPDWTAEGTHVNANSPIVNRTGLSTIGAQYAFGDNTDCSGPITSPITGNIEVCTNDSNVSYSVTDNDNTYTWTITGGTQTLGGSSASITVDWGASGQIGTVSVIEFNGCTYGEVVNLEVEINSIPPEQITGKTAVAEFSTDERYSVENKPGYSYTWSVTGGNLVTGQSSSAVTMDWGTSGTGAISVIAEKSGCVAASPVNLNVLKYNIINSVQSGPWNSASTWSTGTIPSENDNVRILNSHTITLGGNRTIDNIVIDAGATLDAATSKRSLTVNGDITVNGSYQGNTKPLELFGINTIVDGSGTISIAGGSIEISSGNKTILSSSNLNITAGNLDIVDGNVTIINFGEVTIAGDIIGSDASSKWTNRANSVLNIGGALFPTGGTLLASSLGNTIEYTGGAQNIYTPSDNAYYHLNISGTNTKTLQGDILIKGNLNLNGGVLDAGTNRNINISGNWISNGGTFNPATGLVIFDGGNDQTIQSGGSPFYSVQISGSGTKSLLDNLGMINDLTINSNLDISSSNYLVEVGGNFTNNGTFINHQGEVILNGNFDQSFTGFSLTKLCNLTLDKAGGTVNFENTVEFDGSLEILQPLTINLNGTGGQGKLILFSDADQTGRVGIIPIGTQINGSGTYRRYVPNLEGGRFWRYLASPVDNVTVESLKSFLPVTGTFNDPSTQVEWPGIPGIVENSPSIYVYNETLVTSDRQEGWESWPSAGTNAADNSLIRASGYAVFIRIDQESTIEFEGTEINFQNPSVDVTSSGPSGLNDPNGWNLIGNPFASPINWDNVTKPAGVNNEIHLLDNANSSGMGRNAYLRYVGGVGTPASFTGEIPLGQAFWVRATSNATITFKQLDKATQSSFAFIRKKEPNDLLRIRLAELAGNRMDETVIRFHPEGTNTFDKAFDANQLKLTDVSISSILEDGMLISINTLNEDFCEKEVRIAVLGVEEGEYEMNFSNLESFSDGMSINFLDAYADKVINIFNDPVYQFVVNDEGESYGHNRFKLLFSRRLSDSIEVDYDHDICNQDQAYISIFNAQRNVEFSLLNNQEPISQFEVDTTGNILLMYDINTLQNGSNQLKLNAILNGCGQWEYIMDIEIIKNSISDPVVIQNTTCNNDPVIISVIPSNESSTFLWYESYDSENSIEGVHGIQLTTPILAGSRSYWVEEVHSSGCVSNRIEVPIEIIEISIPIISSDGYTLFSSSETGNQWFLDGEPIPGATEQIIETVYPGEYTVRVSADQCFEFSEPYIQLISEIGSELDNEFHIYPNPVDNFINIEFNQDVHFADEFSVEIYQLDGQMLLKSKIDIGSSPLDLSWLKPGFYVVRMVANEQIFTKKFLKK